MLWRERHSESHSQAGIEAAYGLAVRMTGSELVAEEIVVRSARRVGTDHVALVRAVRADARDFGTEPSRMAVTRPDRFQAVSAGDWEIVERVALRGMTLTDAAEDAGLSRSEAIVRLQRGMRAGRASLEGRHATDHAQPATVGALG